MPPLFLQHRNNFQKSYCYENFHTIFSLIIALPCFSADYQPRCKDEISYAYDIYQQAIQSAKDGNCEKSLSQFKESEKQWICLSKLSVCKKEEK